MKVMNESTARVLLRHRRALARRVASRLGAAEAEDLASEAMARGLARPSPDGRQAPWIETIFRNLLRDDRRRSGRRGEAVPLREDLVATTATPEEVMLAAERSRVVSGAMPAIPDEQREALVARFFDDEDYDQLAARWGITSTTARTRVHRGLARLRVVLGRAWAWIPMWPRGFPGFGAHAATTALVPAAAVAVAIFTAAPVDGARVGSIAPEHAETSRLEHRRRAAGRSAVRGGAPETSRGDGLEAEAAASAGSEAARPSNARRTGPAASRPAAGIPAAEDPSTRAAPTGEPGANGAGPPVAVRRFAFDEEEVEGDLKRPGSEVVTGDPGHERLESLIEIPASFEPSMTKMIEDM